MPKQQIQIVAGLESLLNPLSPPAVVLAPSPADLLSASSEAKPLPLLPDAGRAMFFASNFSTAPQNALPGLDQSQLQPQLQPLSQWNEQTLARQTQTLGTINLNDPLSQDPFGDASLRKPQGSGGGGGGSGGGAGGGGGGEAPQVSFGSNGLGTGQPMNMTPGALNGGAPPPTKANSTSNSGTMSASNARPAQLATTKSGPATQAATVSNTANTANTTSSPTNNTGLGVSPQPSSVGQNQAFFEQNVGQAGATAAFVVHGLNYQALVSATETDLLLPTSAPDANGGVETNPTVIQILTPGGNPDAQVVGQNLLIARTNYFTGNDPSQYHVNVPTYAGALVQNIYPGIDLSWTINASNQLEYSWIVHPGGDPSQIEVQYQGQDSIASDGQGGLVLQTPTGQLTQSAPVFSQQIGGVSVAVQGALVLGDNGTLTVQAGSYDPSQNLLIDPTIIDSTYLGGSGSDSANGVATDAAGNTYVVDSTSSSNFPTANPLQGSLGSGTDIFVTKFDPNGNMLYSTYLGGSSSGQGYGIAVDSAGDAWVTGSTDSTNFPTVNPVQASRGAGYPSSNAFLSEINPSGDDLLFSTYLGGSFSDTGYGVAVDSSGQVYVVGTTGSSNFPTTVGAYQTSLGGLAGYAAFVTKYNAAHTGYVYSTYFGNTGGSISTDGKAIAVDNSGNAYFVGYTYFSSFPTTSGSFQTTFGGGSDSDAFITKLSSSGSSLVYSSFLGGSGSDYAYGVAVDSSGAAYITGSTNSTNFPTAGSPFKSTLTGAQDAFVSKVNPAGTTLVYSSYYGGTSTTTQAANAIALDSSGDAYITGLTDATDLPTVNAFQTTKGGSSSNTNAFVAEVNSSGSNTVYSSYLGGSSADSGNGIAVDPNNIAHVTGSTKSSNFPVKNAHQGTLNGTQNAFVTLIDPNAPPVFSVTSLITNNQTPTISGTTLALATVTLYQSSDLSTPVGTTTANSSGAYSYTSATLAAGSYGFLAQAVTSTVTTRISNPLPVVIDLTAPTVTLVVDNTTSAKGPQLHVTAWDAGGIAATTTVTIDVDLLDDGSFSDPGDAGYATATMTNGSALFQLSPTLAAGSYHIRADVNDLAGNTGRSASQALTISSTSSSTLTDSTFSVDPLQSNALELLGTTQVSQSLDLDQSGGMLSGNFALAYNSDRVNSEPIISATLQTPNNVALPSTITAQLTWNGGSPQTAHIGSSTRKVTDVRVAKADSHD